MSKTVYFIRHGECIANVKGVIAGASDDSPLTDLGKSQALDTARGIADIDFDLIVSSPLVRAKDTATIIANELHSDKELIIRTEFIEKDVGEFSGRPKAEYFAFEKSGGDAGETADAMQQRVQEGLEWLRAQDFTVALVVTHNGTVRMVRTILENVPAKEFVNMSQLANGEFLKVEL